MVQHGATHCGVYASQKCNTSARGPSPGTTSVNYKQHRIHACRHSDYIVRSYRRRIDYNVVKRITQFTDYTGQLSLAQQLLGDRSWCLRGDRTKTVYVRRADRASQCCHRNRTLKQFHDAVWGWRAEKLVQLRTNQISVD